MLLSIILHLLNFHYCFTYKEDWYAVRFENHANDWVELVDHEKATRSDPLSTEDFAYARRVVEFDFPFYEDSVNQLQVTSTGFLTTGTGNILNLAESSRYIAPLMGPFSANDVRHYSNSKVFINQWTGLPLRDQPQAGGFTFQVQLHCDGVIKFIYKEVPMLVRDINTTAHAVRVGLCDSYEDADNRLQRYDQLELDMGSVRSNTTFTMTPIPSCGSMKTCSRCLRHSQGCVWCSEIQRCSTPDGLDMYHRLWTLNGCPADATRSCPVPGPTSPPPQPSNQCNRSETSSVQTIEKMKPTIPSISQEPSPKENTSNSTSSDTTDTSSLIIITIGICSLCVSSILVISALLIRRYGRRVLVNKEILRRPPPAQPCSTQGLLNVKIGDV